MTPEQYQRAKSLFGLASEVVPEDRSAWLEQSESDAEVRSAVMHLLANADDSHQLVDSEIAGGGGARVLAAQIATFPSEAHASSTPERIGKYRIVRAIGRGGMGVVYQAEQDHPRRTVALKILPSSYINTQRLSRFRREADLLGRLQHPGIAQIYEAGVADVKTDAGVTVEQPYFAMELVQGKLLDDYARDEQLSLRDRLTLFAKVCDAVHHAHDRGVLHRDLKPANIMVEETDEGSADGGVKRIQPKVLDFGVSRATSADVHTLTLQTNVGQLVGTLPYMSPEQVAGKPELLDNRSDVYSLGVVLFELLSDRLPHDLKNVPIPEAVRIIQDDDPTRLSSINRELRGDIETIVAKALEKDKERRYQSAAELGADLRRFLTDEPLLARPASTFYQLRKFARRNRGLMTGLGATFVALAVGLVGVTWLALREADARRVSDRASYRANIGVAAASIRERDIATAERHLDAAPEALRNWVWAHLQSNLDESLASTRNDLDLTQIGQWDIMRGQANAWFSDAGDFVHVALSHSGKLHVETREGAGLELSSVWDTKHFPHAPSIDGREILGGPGHLDAQTGQSGQPVAPLIAEPEYFHRILSPIPKHIVSKQSWSYGKARLDGIFPAGFAVSRDGSRGVGIGNSTVAIFAPHESDPEIVLEPHAEGATDAVFTPDNRYVITASNDRRLASFDIEHDGRRVWQQIDAHDDAVLAVAISPDGKTLASGGQDRVLRLWNAQTGAPLGARVGHRDPILAIQFSDDGERIATCSATHVKVWEFGAFIDPGILGQHSWLVHALAGSPDGSLLASGGKHIRLWDVASGVRIHEWAPSAVVTSLSFSADGKRLAASSEHGYVIIDLCSGKELLTRRFDKGSVNAEFGALGRFLIQGPNEQPELLHADSLEVIETLPYSDSEFCFDPAGRFVTSKREQTLRLHTLSPFSLKHEWKREATASCFVEAGGVLAAGTADGKIVLLDTESGQQRGVLDGHVEEVTCLVELPGQGMLVSGSDDRTIRLWDLEHMEEITAFRGHLDTVWGLHATPDGKTLFSASGDYTVRRWDTRPVSELLKAQNAYEETVARMGPRIDTLLDELGDATLVADQVRADPTLSPRERQIALHCVLKTSIARADAEGAKQPILDGG